MKISVNGVERDVKAKTLAELLTELGYDDMPVATALNQTVVSKRVRHSTEIRSDDRIEILVPMQGG